MGSLVGSATSVAGELILAQNITSVSGFYAWYESKMQVRGFQTGFTYKITNYSQSLNQRPDGMAFVIQSAGLDATGTSGPGLGYGTTTSTSSYGIRNSVAVEFDSFCDGDLGDLANFHIGIHANGPNVNNASEIYRIGYPNSGFYMSSPDYDLDEQHIVISYDPIAGGGTMTIQLSQQPTLVVTNVNLNSLVNLDAFEGNAFIGFTGSHRATVVGETISVRNWWFNFLGVVNATNSIVDGLDSTVAGENLTFYVQAVDQYGYNMTTDGVNASNYILSATLVQPGLPLQTATASYSGPGSGLYKLSINATLSGNSTVNVVFNNSQLIGARTYNLLVIPAAPSASNSFPYGAGLDTAVIAGELGTFLVQLRDAFGNNITTDVGQVVSATISDGSYSVQATSAFDPSLSCYRVTYNVTLAGDFNIAVTVNGVATNDSAHTLHVDPAGVYPATSVLSGVASSATAGELQLASLQLKDVFGNNADNANVDISIQVSQGAIVVNGTVTSTTAGLCTISYNLTVASDQLYNVSVLVDSLPVAGSFGTVKVQPAALAPSVSYAYGEGLTHGVAGVYSYFSVQLTDVFGNNITATQQNLSVSPSLTSNSLPTIFPTALASTAGTYPFQYNLTVATSYTLTVQVNTVTTTNGNTNVVISPAPVHPASCIGFGTGLSGDLVVGANHSFSVQLRDVFLNNITTQGSETLLVEIYRGQLSVNPYMTFIAGLYQVSYNITLASVYTLNITVNEIPILNSQQSITLVPASIFPSECVATSVVTGVVAGALNQFHVQLRDVFANDITTVPDPDNIVTASLMPAVTVRITYSGAGRYALAYNATKSENYTLSVLVNEAKIQGSGQYDIQVAPAAAYPPLCVAQGAALTASTAGAHSSFSIYLFDVFSNPIRTHVVAPTVSITSPTEQPVSVTFNVSGHYVASYNITVSSSYTLEIAVGGVPIGTPAAPLAISPAPLYVANCLANGESATAGVAGAEGQFTVLQRDQFGNLITDYLQVNDFVFQMVLADTSVPTENTKNQDGTYTLNYNITVSGFYTTTITINHANILHSPFNTSISPAPFDPHGTVTVGLASLVTAGALNQFSIQLKDIFGNDVTDENAPNPITPGDIAVLFNNSGIAINATLISAGVFLVAYNHTKAGEYWMNVQIKGVEVGPSAPGYIRVQPNDVYPPLCTAEGPATIDATVKKSNTFTLFVRDRFSNLRMWSPTPPLITLTSLGQNVVHGDASNQTDGSYLVSYFIEEKSTYQLSVTFNGEHISGSPFTVNAYYGNNSPNTVVIVCSVLGSVAFVAVVAYFGYRLYKRRAYGNYQPL